MKILVYAHELVVGGTPLNSIELAAALRDLHGHEVILLAAPGPMLELVREKNLRYAPVALCDVHPSPSRMMAVRSIVRREQPDIIHAWDWFQGLEAYYSVYLPLRIPMIITDMFMTPTRVLPKTVPTTYGTPDLVDQARGSGRSAAELLLPPVDVRANAPGVVDATGLRRKFSIDSSTINVVTVSRLNFSMKFESIRRSIEAVGRLGTDLPLRLLIVGGGEAGLTLERLAERINEKLKREAVSLMGELLDPRPAYELADFVVGMGGSALRGMAFGKPVLIVGENGFSEVFGPESADWFYYHGMFGDGPVEGGAEKHLADIRNLAETRHAWGEIGDFSREFVVRHFSLESVSGQLSGLCSRAAAESVPDLHVRIGDGLRSVGVYLRERLYLRRAVDRTSGFRAETVAHQQKK